MKCSKMKPGRAYVYENRGLELKVVKASDCEEGSFSCEDLPCCGSELKLTG